MPKFSHNYEKFLDARWLSVEPGFQFYSVSNFYCSALSYSSILVYVRVSRQAFFLEHAEDFRELVEILH